MATLVASLTFLSLSASDLTRSATPRSAAFSTPIVVTMPAAPGAAVTNAQYSSQDVYAGMLSGVQTPVSGISPLQRMANLNPANFRIHAGTDGGAVSVALPFNTAYTSSDGITVLPWDFTHLNSLIANTVGRTSGSTMLNVRYAPDNMFAGSGPMGGNGNAPGALLDQTYGAFATYMANLVRYYNTASPPTGAIPPRPAIIGPIRYWEIWNEPDFSSENPRIPPSLSAPGTITLSSVSVPGGTLTSGTSYSYRISALTSTNQEGLPSAAQNIVLGPGMNAVRISWTASTNLSRVAAAYPIYGRTGTGNRMAVVGKDNGAGLTWTDTGAITPSGAPPVVNSTPGGAVFSPLEYKALWDQTVPAMRAVDPTIKVVGPATTNPISISPQSVLTTAVTTGPTDTSYLDSRDFVQVLMTSANRPDVISYHGYGGYLGAADSDAALMSATSQMAADVSTNIIPYVGSTPIWHTEANVNAANDTSNRPALAFGAAWQASLFAKLAPIGIGTIHEFTYVNSPTFGLITEPISAGGVPGAIEGNPYLPYWVDYWIDRLFTPGSKILATANVPGGFDVLAVANPPDFTKVKVLVVNRQVPATNNSVPVQLTGATSSATRVRVIDATTNVVTGPTLTNAGVAQTVTLQLNGYSVALVEFDTGVLTCTATTTPLAMTAISTLQYNLMGSDGATWQEIDPTSLRLVCVPTASQSLVLTGNADLWTANAGYNQDLGIFVSDNAGPDQLLAWKESGGFAGTYSPNAAYVQTLFNMTSGHTYLFKLMWKTNKPAPGATIFAGAGNGPYSPTSLLAQAFPAGSTLNFTSSNTQYRQVNPRGDTWQIVDPNLSTSLTPNSNATVVLGANADLWTASAGYNQDLGIFVSVDGAPDQLVAWKESGGFAGTYSPNAAFVKATYAMTAGHTYVFKLKWKTNINAPGATIYAAAGSALGYSPTTLLAQTITAGANPYTAVSTLQYSSPSSDGATWLPIDPALNVSVGPLGADNNSIVGANADLWTANAGVNQDIGVFVSDNGQPDVLVAWKESGGFAGTYSPNAAFVQAMYPMTSGHTYVFKLKWKTNKPAFGASIFAAAGGSAPYSPTRLTVELAN